MQPQQWAWQGLGWIWADFCTKVCWQKHSVRTLPSKWPPLLQPLLSEMCLGSIRGPDAHWKINHDSPEDVDQKATLSVKSSLGNCSWICYFILKILSQDIKAGRDLRGHLVHLADEETGRKQLHGQAGSWPESSCLLRPVLGSFLTPLVCSPSLSCPTIHILVRGGRLSVWRHVSNEMIL